MTTTVTVRWDDFEAAFFIGSPDARYFLDTRDGTVEYTSHMDGSQVRERVLRQTGAEGWIEIPRAGPEAGLKEIAAFADTQPPEIAENLRASLKDSVPFRAFNRAMAGHPEVRRAWRQALMDGIHRRLLSFCRANDLLIDDDRFQALAARLES